LKIEKKKLSFNLNEKNYPTSYKIEERYESMKVVEEYMLLANKLVARKLV
jgi:exoribonuclease R